MTPTARGLDGNGVFETGETAILQPSWRNDSGGVQVSVAGAVSNFSGPVGPTYTGVALEVFSGMA